MSYKRDEINKNRVPSKIANRACLIRSIERFNFLCETRRSSYLHVLTLSVSIRSTIRRSRLPNWIRQILNRKSIIAQLDLNSCNSTVIAGNIG